jgi:hypothetical protein
LKLLRVSLADVLDDCHSDTKRLESFAVSHVQLCAGAEFTGKFVKGRLKVILAKENSLQS